jgi:glycerophosphoryl diester phosphodiesterase
MAFNEALALGVDGLEFDVQLSSDHVPVIFHDATVNRTTQESGKVSEKSLAQLRRLNAAQGWPQVPAQPIPLLEEVLQLIAQTHPNGFYNIEVKVYNEDWKALVDRFMPILLQYPFGKHVLISSFYHPCLRYLQEQFPGTPVGLLYEDKGTDPCQDAKRLGAYSVNMDYQFITKKLVEDCHAAAVKVCAWTVDDALDLRTLAAWGVDVLISNHPNVALQAVRTV